MFKPVAWMHQNPEYPISKHWSQEYNIPLYTHPVKELDEQFEKGFEAGKEEGWKAHKFYHPVKEQDESFDRTASHMAGEYVSHPVKELTLTDDEVMDLWNQAFSHPAEFARAILRKAQE